LPTTQLLPAAVQLLSSIFKKKLLSPVTTHCTIANAATDVPASVAIVL